MAQQQSTHGQKESDACLQPQQEQQKQKQQSNVGLQVQAQSENKCSDMSPNKSSSSSALVQFTQKITSPSSPLLSDDPIVSSQSHPLAAPGLSDESDASVSMSTLISGTSHLQLDSRDATKDPDWQSDKCSLRERNSCMLNNDLMSDVTLVIGDERQRVPAHKYILATGSSVFYAMFYGGLKSDSQEVEIPDVELDAFLTLLKYLYTDSVDLNNGNVLSTLYASKKYLIVHLSKACVEYLECNLNADNACILLSQSRLFDEARLTSRCWQVIDAKAEMALNSQHFVDIDFDTLKCILERDTLNCRELSIFNGVVAWATAQCLREGLEITGERRRSVLKDALFLIRIPTMTLKEFANGPAQSGILTLDECNDIFLYYTADIKPALAFSTTPRRGLPIQVCKRFQSSAYRCNQWRYCGRCDSIQFSVDKRIFVTGFGLYGSSSGSADYTVRMELKKASMGRVVNLAEKYAKFHSNGSSDTFPVFFDNPIQVEADVQYTASITLEGSELSYFGQDGFTEVAVNCGDSLVTFQFQCSPDSTNGTGVQGGQLPEILFYAPTG